MNLPVTIPDSSTLPRAEAASFGLFLQRMANRIAVGFPRYGSPHRRKKYLSRIERELEAYKRSGNGEHLFNIANYAYLESEAPEHLDYHFNPEVDSVTRKEFGV